MPTPSLMQIPKSRSEEEFESICTDVLNKKYNGRFKRYGRKGQGQGGIDIYDESSSMSYIVGQCKNYYNKKSATNLIKKIKEDIGKLNELPFYNNISRFIAMTSMDRDTKVQNEILGIKSSIEIEVLFWDNIQEEICCNEDLLQKYYPQFFSNSISLINISNEIIGKANILIRCVKYLTENIKGLNLEYGESINLYNCCVTIFLTASELQEVKDKWYLQLESLGILNMIEDILISIPPIYDASNDYTGTNIIGTIYGYNDYFNNVNCNKFIEICKKIVSKLSN